MGKTTMPMTSLPVMMIRLRVHMNQRNSKHPQHQPQQRYAAEEETANREIL
jgi:hypothetical protein